MATRPPVVNELRDDSQDPEEEDGCDSARESVSESEEVEPQAKLKNSKRMLTSLMLTPEPQQKTQKKEKHLDSPRSRPSSSNGNGSSKKRASMKGASSSKGSSSKPSRLNSLRSAGSSMNVKKKMRHATDGSGNSENDSELSQEYS